jgi:hypothetical protein
VGDGLRGKGTVPHEKTPNFTEQDTCNTSYPGGPEEFKKQPITNNLNASPITECKAILAGTIVLD